MASQALGSYDLDADAIASAAFRACAAAVLRPEPLVHLEDAFCGRRWGCHGCHADPYGFKAFQATKKPFSPWFMGF